MKISGEITDIDSKYQDLNIGSVGSIRRIIVLYYLRVLKDKIYFDIVKH